MRWTFFFLLSCRCYCSTPSTFILFAHSHVTQSHCCFDCRRFGLIVRNSFTSCVVVHFAIRFETSQKLKSSFVDVELNVVGIWKSVDYAETGRGIVSFWISISHGKRFECWRFGDKTMLDECWFYACFALVSTILPENFPEIPSLNASHIANSIHNRIH